MDQIEPETVGGFSLQRSLTFSEKKTKKKTLMAQVS